MQHPDITRIERDGYVGDCENQDTHENRLRYFKDRASELLKWLLVNYSEALDEFIEDNDQDYQDWLN